MAKQVDGLDDQASTRLLTYEWPGNIRELENAMERAVLMADEAQLRLTDLPPEIVDEEIPVEPGKGEGTMRERVKDATARIERQMILDALEKTGNNVTQAAKVLGLSRKGLQIKLKALGLRGDDS
jgi:DNA-binding NtrC family response regulator